MNECWEVLACTMSLKIILAKYNNQLVTKEPWINLFIDVKVECVGMLNYYWPFLLNYYCLNWLLCLCMYGIVFDECYSIFLLADGNQ